MKESKKINVEEKLTFRRLSILDLDEILKIEHASFPSPWSKNAFLNELTTNPYAIYIGAEMAGKLVAYGGVWLILDEAHITNIAVLPEFRGKKIGEKLFRVMMDTVIKKGCKRASLEVRVSNTIAQNLYRKFGFNPGGIRKGYYSDNHEDALVMWVNFDE